MRPNTFSEFEMNRANVAGINREALQVAREYPNSTFGKALRQNLDNGNVSAMYDARKNGQDPSIYWMSGYFSKALAFGTLREAFHNADDENLGILVDVHGVPEGANFSDEMVAKAEARAAAMEEA